MAAPSLQGWQTKAASSVIKLPSKAQDTGTSALLAALVIVALLGLHVILRDTLWWLQVSAIVLLVLGAAAATRALLVTGTKRRFLPSIVATVVLVGTIVTFFAPRGAVLTVIPTAETLRQIGALFAEAGDSINRQSLPAFADTSIVFLLCLSIGLLAIVADLIAIAFRATALAGLPIVVVLAVPGVVLIDSSDIVVFVLCLIGYLLLIRTARQLSQTRAVFGLSVTIVVAALVVPALLPAIDPAEDVATGLATGVNPVLSLGSDLRQGSDRPVLQYTTSSGDAHYERLVSIDEFSGANWAPTASRVNTRNTVNDIGDPPGLSNEVARTTETTSVRVQDLSSPWLPLAYPTSRVTGLDGNWYWDSVGLAVKSPDRTVSGQTYKATSLTLEPTPGQLEAAGTTVPAGFSKYLELPSGMPSIIAETAQSVAGQASSNYQKALLLQDYFHDGDFDYSETAPVEEGYDGTGMRVIAQFLRAKSGYCIHFASSMAVMARILGIPSRVAVGFLPGDRVLSGGSASTFEVTSHDLHAWPELYFEGIGWTRFEPTVSRGDVPDYADPASSDVPVPTNAPDPAASASAAPSTSASALPKDASSADPNASAATSTLSIGSVLKGVGIALGILVLLLVPAITRAVQRRRRWALLRSGTVERAAALAWREVLQTDQDLGGGVPPTTTPRDASAMLAGGLLADSAALRSLLDAVERESYAQPGATLLTTTVLADARAIVSAQRSTAGRARRLRATFVPTSLWSSLAQRFDL